MVVRLVQNNISSGRHDHVRGFSPPFVGPAPSAFGEGAVDTSQVTEQYTVKNGPGLLQFLGHFRLFVEPIVQVLTLFTVPALLYTMLDSERQTCRV